MTYMKKMRLAVKLLLIISQQLKDIGIRHSITRLLLITNNNFYEPRAHGQMQWKLMLNASAKITCR